MSKSEDLKERLIQFAISILKATRRLPKTPENIIFINQIIRSSSSIGANYSEAIYAHSRAEFIHLLNISRKETSETLYWLDIIDRTSPSIHKLINEIREEGLALLKIFVSSIKTAKIQKK